MTGGRRRDAGGKEGKEEGEEGEEQAEGQECAGGGEGRNTALARRKEARALDTTLSHNTNVQPPTCRCVLGYGLAHSRSPSQNGDMV